MTCNVIKTIWNASGINLNSSYSSVISWLKSLDTDEIALSKCLIILYHIWKARNHLIFRNIEVNSTKIAFSAAYMFNTYAAGKFKTKVLSATSLPKITWNRPPDGMIKLNFDGSVKADSTASSGFILRNSNGKPLLASSKLIGKSNVLCAEAFALKVGLHAALIHGHSKIQVEGDSKILIDSINKKCNIPWRIHSLVKDIWMLASNFATISFHHILREANFAADAVANFDNNFTSASSW